MKKLILSVLFLCMLPSNALADAPYRIGIIIPLSGNVAELGLQSKRGAELALKHALNEDPGLKVELYFEDSQWNARTGLNAYHNLRVRDRVSAVVTGASHVSMAVKPLAKQDKIIQMAIYSATTDYSSADDLAFRMSTVSSIEAQALINFIRASGMNRIAILYVENDYGMSMFDDSREYIVNHLDNTELIFSDSFLAEQSDFRSELMRISRQKADALIVYGLAVHTATVLRQASALQMEVPVFGARSTQDSALLDLAGSYAEGFRYTYSFDESMPSEISQRFVSSYQKNYGIVPDAYSAEAYEGTRILIKSFQKCGHDPECAADFIGSLQKAPSLFGEISFDRNGDVLYDFFMKEVRDGKFVRSAD